MPLFDDSFLPAYNIHEILSAESKHSLNQKPSMTTQILQFPSFQTFVTDLRLLWYQVLIGLSDLVGIFCWCLAI